MKKMSFVFPKDLENLNQVSSALDLKNLLKIASDDSESDGVVSFKICQKKSCYIYANCKMQGCKAFLRYKLAENSMFELQKWMNNHEHCIPKSKKHRFAAAKAYINQIPHSIPLSSLKFFVCR
jgi:hypothetical protein